MTSLLVPHAGASAALVRHELVRELRGAGVPEDVVDDAVLVMSELVGNAVRHGRPLPDSQDAVRASWWVEAGAVHVEVCDGGPGLPWGPPTAQPAAPTAHAHPSLTADAHLPSPTAEGGRGLPIIDLLSTRWGVTAPSPAGGVTVYAELPLGPGPGAGTSGDGQPPAPASPWALRTAALRGPQAATG